MSIPLQQHKLSDWFEGPLVRQQGAFSHIDIAESAEPGAIVYCQTKAFMDSAVANPNVTAIITTDVLQNAVVSHSKGLVVTEQPRNLFFRFYKKFVEQGLMPLGFEPNIADTARIHPTAIISPKCIIGSDSEIAAGAIVEDGVRIGRNVFVGPGAVIGADGLVDFRGEDGSVLIRKHGGSVVIEDGAVILARAVIVRSLFTTPTYVGRRCQIGIQSTIGHGASVGEGSTIAGSSLVAGRASLGKGVWVGAASAIAQGVAIGDRAQLKIGSVAVRDVPAGATVSGNFAVSHSANLKRLIAGAE